MLGYYVKYKRLGHDWDILYIPRVATCHNGLSFTNCLWQLAKEFHLAAMVAGSI